MPDQPQKSLREAMAATMSMAGPEILADPNRLLSYLLDLADGDSTEMKVLNGRMDDAVLAPYRSALENPTADGLVRASRLACDLLVRDRMMQEVPSRAATEALGWGIGDWLGIPMPAQTPRPSSKSMPEVEAAGAQDRGAAQTGQFHPVQPDLRGTSAGQGQSAGTAAGIYQQGGSYGQSGGQYGQSGGSYHQPGSSQSQSGGSYGPSAGSYHQPGSSQSQSGGIYTHSQSSVSVPAPPQNPPTQPKGFPIATFLTVFALSVVVLVGVIFFLPHSVAFEGDGASGSMSQISARAMQSVTLPECSFSYEGLEFAGWSVSAGGSTAVAEPGDSVTMPLFGDVTVTARWVLPSNTVSTNVLVRSTDSNGNTVRIVEYTNNSNYVVDLVLSASFLDSSEKEVATDGPQSFYGIGPGESIPVMWQTSESEDTVKLVRSNLSTSISSYLPTSDHLSCKEASRTSDKVTVSVTNNGSETAANVFVIALQHDDNGGFCYVMQTVKSNNHRVEGGETVDVTLEVGSDYLATNPTFDYYVVAQVGGTN